MGSSVLNDEVPPLCWVISSSSVEYSSSSSVPHCGRSWGCARGACRRGTAGARAPRAQSSIACCACPCLRQPRGPPGTSSTAAAAARRRSRDEFSSPTSSMARSCRSAASSGQVIEESLELRNARPALLRARPHSGGHQPVQREHAVGARRAHLDLDHQQATHGSYQPVRGERDAGEDDAAETSAGPADRGPAPRRHRGGGIAYGLVRAGSRYGRGRGRRGCIAQTSEPKRTTASRVVLSSGKRLDA